MNLSIWVIVISLLVGLLLAAIVTGAMKAQLTSIKSQSAAGFYESQQLNLTQSQDVFLYKRVTKVPRQQPQNNNNNNRPGGMTVTHAPHPMAGPGSARPGSRPGPMGRPGGYGRPGGPHGPAGRGPGRR